MTDDDKKAPRADWPEAAKPEGAAQMLFEQAFEQALMDGVLRTASANKAGRLQHVATDPCFRLHDIRQMLEKAITAAGGEVIEACCRDEGEVVWFAINGYAYELDLSEYY